MPPSLDLDGLQVAYLGSALAHYLDLDSGEIVDVALEADELDPQRFRRIPTRTAESEAEDRRLFVAQLPLSAMRSRLAALLDDAMAFRQGLAQDLTVQRAFFNFKNAQATRAIEEWLRVEGLA